MFIRKKVDRAAGPPSSGRSSKIMKPEPSASWRTVPLSACIAVLLISATVSGQSPFTMATAVKRGVPTANGESFFTCNGCAFSLIGSRHALNNNGDLLIFADSSSYCPPPTPGGGDYIIAHGGSARVADFCHQSPIGLPQALSVGSLNDSGDVSLQL